MTLRMKIRHQKGNSRRPTLLDKRERNGVTEYLRTDTGEFFHDVGMTQKTLKWLSRKWGVPLGELRKLRKIVKKRLA